MPKNTLKTGDRGKELEPKNEKLSQVLQIAVLHAHKQAEGGPGPKLAMSLVLKASCTAARTTLR